MARGSTAEPNQEKGRLTMATDMLGGGALAEVAGPFKDFAEKLGSSEGPMWLSAFKRFLRKENPWTLKLIKQVTVTIGGVSKGSLLKRLTDGGYSVSDWARDIIGKPAFTTLPKPIEIELGWITVRDLGFTKEPTTDELFTRIKEVGDLCPAEVGPHLRLVDSDQQRGTWYWVAMETITDSHGDPLVFSVRRSGGGERWLDAYYANPHVPWYLGSAIVLVLRK